MDLPRISIITPTRNHAEFIAETIESIAAQGYPNVEHIVLDAMSTDATPEILNRYARLPHLRVVREPDSGQSDAINKGMRLATGDIAAWLNSDDLLYPDALEAIADGFRRNPRAGVVYGRGAKIRRDGSLNYVVPFRPFNARDLRTAYRVVQPAMYFRRAEFLAAGGLDESLEYAMDWELLIRLARRCEVAAIDRIVAKIRYYDETKTSTGGWRRMREIAGIGRRTNGPLDLNYVSFRVRSIVSRLDSKLAEKLADELLRRVFASAPVMVQGWPRWYEPSAPK